MTQLRLLAPGWSPGRSIYTIQLCGYKLLDKTPFQLGPVGQLGQFAASSMLTSLRLQIELLRRQTAGTEG